MKKVLFIVFGGANKPSTYYRVFQYLNKLYENNSKFIYKTISTPQKPALKKYPRFLQGLIHVARLVEFYFLICYYILGWAEKVFIQKTILPQFIIRLLTKRKIPFLFDLDDAIYVSFSKAKKTKKKSRIKALQYMLNHAEMVIAGNQILRDYVAPFQKKCKIIPTVIDLDTYCLQEDFKTFNYTIGWIGTSQNLVFLEMIANSLRALHNEFPQLKLLVICDKPFEVDDFTINKKWSRETKIEDMLTMDIGIMPLVDDEWTRGKCSFKAIQYMALGIPTVASPVGMNTQVIQDGINGYLASSEEEWVQKLRNLIIDHKLRHTFSIAGRKQVETKYSLQEWLKEWCRLVFEAN